MFRFAKVQLLCIFVLLFLTILKAETNTNQIDSLKKLILTNQSDSAQVHLNVELSQAFSTNDLKQSVEYANLALEEAEKSNDNDLIAYALFNAGNAYFTIGLHEKATQYYYQYLDIQKKKKSQCGIAYATSNLGAIMLQLEKFDKAKSLYLQALQTLTSLQDDSKNGHSEQIPFILNNLGIAYQNLKQPDSALFYYKKGVRLGNDNALIASLYNNIASLYLEQNDAKNAYDPLIKGLEIRLKEKDLIGQVSSYNLLSDYYQLIENDDESRKVLYKALKISKDIGSEKLILTTTENLFKYYDKKADSDSALFYHILFKELSDKAKNEETIKEFTRLELTTQFKEREQLQIIEQKRRESRLFFVGFSLLLMLLIFILLYYLTRNRLKQARLERKNIILTAQNAELERNNLEKELDLKKKELTTHVMYQIRKNELIRQITEELLANNQNFKVENQQLINRIIKNLDKLQDSDNNIWEEFELRFQHVHNDFNNKINKLHPNLTTNERRLCAFLRLNMTTKEIASITGQSPRSLEVARTRLRKKLDLTNSETGLVEYLASF